ncbi:cartilage acidic protein 1 [Cyanistes caeruleus]|uniref:cartilage acidic protein 1 n=1 Tax=Cyanistes caeruleus TaxID=156563 RepID=UPI000CDB25FC|nr:cartilage acidic protein 1 [Cyanistes caeruleus]
MSRGVQSSHLRQVPVRRTRKAHIRQGHAAFPEEQPLSQPHVAHKGPCSLSQVSRMLALCLLSLAWLSEGSQRSEPMFAAVTHRLLPPDYDSNPTQLNYGVAVTDLDADGDFEIVVAGYNGPNLVLKYDKAQGRLVNVAEDERGSPYYALRDRQGNAIGVTACDIDGDGREEIYFLNTNNAFSGMATYTDKLFKLRNGRWEDILSDEVNRDVASRFAGRSVACVDRTGSGRYSIYIANYASGNVGPHALIEMDVAASDPARGVVVLVDVAAQAGVSKYTGTPGFCGPAEGTRGRARRARTRPRRGAAREDRCWASRRVPDTEIFGMRL